MGEFREHKIGCGVLEYVMRDGRHVHIIPLFHGQARLCVVADAWTYSVAY